MGFALESTFGVILCTLLLMVWILYAYTTQKFNYWRDKGVPYNKPSFPFGSTTNMFLGRKHIGNVFNDFYNEFKDAPFFGVYEGRRPTLVLKDPDLIKHVLIKDFNCFYDRALFPFDKKKDYISNHLFNMCGDDWRRMRLKLTPTFTSGKMKLMFLLMTTCGEQLKECVDKKVSENAEVDVKDVLVRFTMDIIASCAFGLEINSLSDSESEFYHMGTKIFKAPGVSQLAARLILSIFPFITKIYMPRFVPSDVSDFLTKIVRDTTKYREENNVNRNDFLNLLIKIRQNKNDFEDEEKTNSSSVLEEKQSLDKSEFTIEEITAQVFVFFIAGFETASSTMTFCLYELARNPDIQERLYQEIKQTLSPSRHDSLTYQAVQDMPYMDQVINDVPEAKYLITFFFITSGSERSQLIDERTSDKYCWMSIIVMLPVVLHCLSNVLETLRMYASVAVLHRTCTKTYKMPGSDLVLEKGQRVIIPTYAIHHDPKYYPDPFKFDPERFAANSARERHPCLHLPFGEGSRMCIGMRFGLLQTKVGLATLILNFEFGLSPNTPIPITLSKTSFVTQSEQPIKLRLTRR